MAVHLSLHDVSPAWAAECEQALLLCATVQAKPALLVVPNFHGAWSLDDHPAFCARLRELQAAGHEVYLHGFFHEARAFSKASPAAPPGGEHLPPRVGGRPSRLAWLFAQKVASGGEAEFRDVSQEEAAQRLDEGAAMLQRAGLRIDGFVAPAWSMPGWLMPLLASRGYRFTEDHLRVYDPQAARTRPSVVLNFASRTRGRMLSTVAFCRAAKYARALLPARIAIHPADLRVPLLRRELAALLAWGAGDYVTHGAALLA